MDFSDQIKSISQTINKLQEQIKTEEATKTAFIMPFIQALGYNVFNPMEVHPEFSADIAGLKGEKVDYAILLDDKPVMLVECKYCQENINKSKHSSQLHRYFHATEAKIGILTNGILYHFYTDTDKPNIMDDKPFFEFNMLDYSDSSLNELKRFCKSKINQDDLLEVARNLLYTKEIKRLMAEQLINPAPDFVKFFASQVYSGRLTSSVIEKFGDITQRSLKEFINERITDRLKSAIDSDTETIVQNTINTVSIEEENLDNQTNLESENLSPTQEELDAFYMVKSILREIINTQRVQYKNTKNYLGINLDGKVTKTICRIRFIEDKKTIGILNAEGKEIRKNFLNIDEIYSVSSIIIDRLKFLTEKEDKGKIPESEIIN